VGDPSLFTQTLRSMNHSYDTLQPAFEGALNTIVSSPPEDIWQEIIERSIDYVLTEGDWMFKDAVTTACAQARLSLPQTRAVEVAFGLEGRVTWFGPEPDRVHVFTRRAPVKMEDSEV